MKKIYLATPYSHKSEMIRKMRFRAVNLAAADLMQQGHIVFSPISMSHPIALAGELPKDWEFWKKLDEFFLSVCDEVHILGISGWEESVGLRNEIEIAHRLGKPVTHIPHASSYELRAFWSFAE